MALLSSLIQSAIASGLGITITMDPGGRLDEYTAAAKNVIEHQIQIKIDGRCYSACTLFADQARQHVCITPGTRFFIHQATQHPSGRRAPVQYSPAFHAYVGLQPTEGWLVLDFNDLKKFWRVCLP
jgi:hypothetical protein